VQPAHAFALSLPEAVEHDHHGLASFRVRGKIFATVPDADHLRVMVDESEIRAAVADNPAAFAELWWGSRLACVVVDLRAAPADQVRELLTEAWRRKAPKTLVRAFDAAAAPAPHDPPPPGVSLP
jgi:hypothetical protein